MKNSLFILLTTLSTFAFSQKIITSDIENYWKAYDKMATTKDTILQKKHFTGLFINAASEGQKSMMNLRNYSINEYLININQSPKYWNSIRANTLDTKSLETEIFEDLEKFKKSYPDFTVSDIYFVVGAFRSGGTGFENKVLIGAESSLVDEETAILDDLPTERHWYLKTYKPRKNLALTIVHEYIHTQQKEIVQNLLAASLYEGIAEFLASEITGKASNSPVIKFGKKNQKEILNQFVKDMFVEDNFYNWLWGNNKNHLKERDLGYYVGYEIAERYYNQSTDKQKTIKELIELDYHDKENVERIVNATKIFPKTITDIYTEYEEKRPEIIAIKEIKKGKLDVKTKLLTVTFSEPMNEKYRGFDYGELGEKHTLNIKYKAWSDDKKSLYLEIVDLQPNVRYQLLLTTNFRNMNGDRIKPYLIDVITTKK